jgi:hypothetical protein
MTTDPRSAVSFYESVLGWTAQDSGMPGMDYTICSAGGAMVAGVMRLPDEATKGGGHSFWSGYISVPDVDSYARKVPELGGVVLREPQDIPEVGRFSVVADPHGASFVLFAPSGDQQPDPDPTGPGRVVWRELYAGELESDFEFYGSLLGWRKADAIDMGPMGIYQLVQNDGGTFGGMMKKPERVPRPAWAYYFMVDSVERALERVEKAGGRLLNGPHQVPGGSWIAQCFDPQGAFFGLNAQNK